MPSVIARSVHGAEWVCAAEVCSLIGTEDSVALSRREVTFEIAALSPALLGLRTVDDVFLTVGTVRGVGTTKDIPAAAGHSAAALNWDFALRQLRLVRQIPDAVRFDVVVSLEGKRSYNRYALEAAVGSSLAPVLRAEFLERAPGAGMPGDSDLTVRVFVRGDHAVVALRLGTYPLHRRAYKSDTGAGTLHPPVAAAIAAIAGLGAGVGVGGDGVVLDPFCGDGTIPIEVAVVRPELRVTGSDLDPRRAENARHNAERAGVHIDIACADAATVVGTREVGSVDAILTNPPWNLAVDWAGQFQTDGRRFWDLLVPLLSDGGVLSTVTDAGLEVPALLAEAGWAIGLQQQMRLAGRMVHLLLASPPGMTAPPLPPELRRWRQRARQAGVITANGF